MFNPHEEEEEARDIQELMHRYQNLKFGRANAYIEDRQRCLEAGMTDFMAKPLRPEMLYETVLRALQGASCWPT